MAPCHIILPASGTHSRLFSPLPPDEREVVQKKTFTKWVNSHLARVSCRISDLYKDLRDGRMLIKLLEVLSGEMLVKPVPVPSTPPQEGHFGGYLRFSWPARHQFLNQVSIWLTGLSDLFPALVLQTSPIPSCSSQKPCRALSFSLGSGQLELPCSGPAPRLPTWKTICGLLEKFASLLDH